MLWFKFDLALIFFSKFDFYYPLFQIDVYNDTGYDAYKNKNQPGMINLKSRTNLNWNKYIELSHVLKDKNRIPCFS